MIILEKRGSKESHQFQEFPEFILSCLFPGLKSFPKGWDVSVLEEIGIQQHDLIHTCTYITAHMWGTVDNSWKFIFSILVLGKQSNLSDLVTDSFAS